jgi:anti-anti-sigma regulatory factor
LRTLKLDDILYGDFFIEEGGCMESIGVDYFFKNDKDRRFMYMKIRDVQCNIHQFSNLFGEIGESIVKSSYENICIDLTTVSLVTSSIFGVCINIISVAKESKKHLKFRLNADTMETAKVAGFDGLVELEQGESF